MRAQVYACTGKANEMADDLKNFVEVLPNWPRTNVSYQGWLKKVNDNKRLFFQLKGKYLFAYVSETESQLEIGIYLYHFHSYPRQ